MTEKLDGSNINFPSYKRYLEEIIERDNVDYKLKFSTDKEDMYNTVKVYAALANSGGGLVIYGVDEKAKSLMGIDNSQIRNLNTANLGPMLAKFISPVPSLTVEFFDDVGKTFAFVTVGTVKDSPILVSKTITDEKKGLVLRSGAIFIRSHTRSIEAESETQVRSLLEGIINQQVRQKIAEWGAVFQFEPKTQKKSYDIERSRARAGDITGLDRNTPIREAYFTPEGSFHVLTDDQMRKLLGVRSKLVGLVWPLYATRGEGFTSGKIDGAYLAHFSGNRTFYSCIESLSIYTFSTLLEDDYAKDGFVGHTRFEGTIAVGLAINLISITCKLGWQYMEDVGWNKLKLDYSLRNIRGRKLIVEDFNRVGFYYERASIADAASASVVLTKGPIQHQIETVMALSEEIFSYFDWKPDPVQLEKDITDALNRSYVESDQV
ncbi:MAG: AlbA family DNA-binding domain-containing protein [Pseudobdellovibrionaceae bacterium]